MPCTSGYFCIISPSQLCTQTAKPDMYNNFNIQSAALLADLADDHLSSKSQATVNENTFPRVQLTDRHFFDDLFKHLDDNNQVKTVVDQISQLFPEVKVIQRASEADIGVSLISERQESFHIPGIRSVLQDFHGPFNWIGMVKPSPDAKTFTRSPNYNIFGAAFKHVLQMLVMMQVLCNSKAKYKILLLDEPDSHLDIPRQQEIRLFVQDLCKKHKIQCLLATHSSAVVTQVEHSNFECHIPTDMLRHLKHHCSLYPIQECTMETNCQHCHPSQDLH
jgi:hypothetical protein